MITLRTGLCWMLVLGLMGCGSGSQKPDSQTTQTTPDGKTPPAGGTSLEVANAVANGAGKPFVEKASKLIAQRQYGKAFDELNAALKADPKCAAAYFLRAGIFADASQEQRALSDFSKALELDPKNADFFNARGFFLLTRQQLPAALKDFSAAIKLSPTHAQAYNNRGLVRISMGEHKAAVQDFTEALKANPKNIDALNNRGFAYMQAGDFDKSLADFEGVLRLNPDYINGYNNKGMLHFKREEYPESLAAFTECVNRDRMNAKYYRQRRDVYVKLSDEAGAHQDLEKINWLQELARLNQVALRTKTDPAVWTQRATHLLDGGELQTAENDLKTALKLDPNFVPALLARVRLRLAQKDATQALADANAAIQLEAGRPGYSARGDAYLALKQYDQAIADYETAERFDNHVAEAYWSRAEKLRAEGKTEQADEDQRQALALDPSLENRR